MNWAVEPEERARRERVRTRLFTGMLLAYGYALLGGSVWEPVTTGQPFGVNNALIAVLALAMHAYALYIAPGGESA